MHGLSRASSYHDVDAGVGRDRLTGRVDHKLVEVHCSSGTLALAPAKIIERRRCHEPDLFLQIEGGVTHSSNFLGGSSCVAQGSVPGSAPKRMGQVISNCGSSPSGNLFVGCVQHCYASAAHKIEQHRGCRHSRTTLQNVS